MDGHTTPLVVEAKLMRSQSGHYYSSAILRGCHFTPISKSGNVISRQRYDFFFTGRAEVAPSAILTYWTATGVFAEKEWPEFWILQAIPDHLIITIGENTQNHSGVKGPLDILAYAKGENSADHLMDWWFNWAPANGGQNAVMACWLGEWLNKHKLGEMPEPYPGSVSDMKKDHLPFLPDEAWTFDLPK